MAKIIVKYHKICDTINTIVSFLVIVLLFLLAALLSAAVFYRYVLNDSIYWSAEIARYLLGYIVFLGSTLAHKNKNHISIDILLSYLSKKYDRYINHAISILFLIFWSTVLYGSYKLFPLFMLQTTATLNIPYAYAFAALPISALIWILYVIEDIITGALK